MKKTIYILFALVSVVTLSSCADFLTKEPETNLSPENFFSSDAELELWTNRYYNQFESPDNLVKTYADDYAGSTLSEVAKGTRSPESESWGTGAWQYLRWMNMQLERDGNCADATVRNKYRGVCYFFRAYFYWRKVREYGDIPYYDYVISDTDAGSLHKKRDSRGYVMYRVLQDLDKAAEYLPEAWDTDPVYRLSKYAALALKSRVALFEGTFRKYHNTPDETVGDVTVSADWFLGEAADAADEIMRANKYSLFKDGVNKDYNVNLGAYRNFFVQQDAVASETILAMRFATDLKVRHGLQFIITNNGKISATRRFVNHYLMADGTKVQDQANYETMTYAESFQNRDPRMTQTLLHPGYKKLGDEDETVQLLKNDGTGYGMIKYVSSSMYDTASSSTTDYPIFRYPEVLLNYAEAKAELGALTQDDVDKTVNVIRERVGMPRLVLADAIASPDALLASYYPNITQNAQTGALLEVRRERTVELVAEGFRLWDMLRWKEGKFLTPYAASASNAFEGVYFPALGEYDMNGDGQVDILLYTGTKPSSDAEVAYKVTTASEEGDIRLSEGDKGYRLMYYGETYVWNEVRDYLWPIPENQRQATGYVLSQNPGYSGYTEE